MEPTELEQSVQLGQEGDRVPDGCCKHCLDNGETGGPSKVHRVTAMAHNEAKSLQTTSLLEGKVRCICASRPVLNIDKLRTAKALVEKAVKMHRVFSVRGPYPVIREALRARGWVEQRRQYLKTHAGQRHSSGSIATTNNHGDRHNNDNNDEKEDGPDELYELMCHMVRNEMVYFYWTNRQNAIDINSLQKTQITNHFAKAGSFTTKVGLCMNLRNLHWFDSADPNTFFPRCYRLGAQDEKNAFVEDFRRTACTSLLKCIVEKDQCIQKEGLSCHRPFRAIDWRREKRRKSRPMALSQMIETALKVCQEFLDNLEHNDIEMNMEMPQTLTKEEWAQFIDSYYVVVHGGAEIENTDLFVNCCKDMLQRLREVKPQLDIDGVHNIWIIKPGAKSRGRGIKCTKYLHEILKLVDVNPTLIKESKWVVQKYLERPLLVHGTKFDVRQWFLVTNWNPLTVWFYKKCYLRFSTQPYSLDTLDRSVHLCNNSIQKHLRPSQQRHQRIPTDNMWSDDQFRTFLSTEGQEAQWQSVVVPGMKSAIIHAVQTAQDLMESRKNSFELYGADFMLGRDLHPWLIEINASPTMAPSSHVTSKLCAAVQEDTLRVILDWRVDHTASTGDFQLIYRQAAVQVPQFVGLNLLVEGFKIKSPCLLPPLRPSDMTAPKDHGFAKEKKPAEKKVKPLSKELTNNKETQPRHISSMVLPPPPLLLEPPMPIPGETVTLHLPMTVNSSIHLPRTTQPHSVVVCKTTTESRAHSDKFQPSTTEKHQGPSMPLEMTLSKQSKQTSTSASRA